MDIVAAGILIADQQGKVLVLHRKSFVPQGNLWGPPGGHVAVGQTALAAAKLKTKNEIHMIFSDKDLSFLGDFSFQADGDNVKFSAWIGRVAGVEPSVELNLDGHDRYQWEYPEILLQQKDLMTGMYPVLKKYIQTKNN